MRGVPRRAVELCEPVKGTPFTADQIADLGSVCGWNANNYGIDMSRPGAQAYYDSLLELYSAWEIDFIKADDMTRPEEIGALVHAIEQCGRPMTLSLVGINAPVPLSQRLHLGRSAMLTEPLHPEVGIAPCFPMTWLLTKGVVTAAACEADCPAAVVQTLGTLLSGKPAACLDFVNHTGRCECVELGHCGVGIVGEMAEDEAIAEKSPDRQQGNVNAPALIGQFAYGPKTGVAIAPEPEGGFRILSFTGENTREPARRKLYNAADAIVQEYRQLEGLLLQHGFPHHLAVTTRNISREVAEVCSFLGVRCDGPKG